MMTRTDKVKSQRETLRDNPSAKRKDWVSVRNLMRNGSSFVGFALTIISVVAWGCIETRAEETASKQESADAEQRVDHYGDPLPHGAIARLGSTRWRHEGRVERMAISPDGQFLAYSGGLWRRGPLFSRTSRRADGGSG